MREQKKSYEGFRVKGEGDAKTALKKRRDRAEKNSQGKQTNAVFSVSDQAFIEACKTADVKPTTRQASKFRNGHGKAALAAGRNRRQQPVRKAA
jgi:hypothetical protein